MTQGGDRGRVDHLDGIRALAIGAVLSLHWLSWYSPFLHGGSIGVDIFFVLSGFIITTMLWRRPGTGSVARAGAPSSYGGSSGSTPRCWGWSSARSSSTPWSLGPAEPGEVARRGLLTLGQGSAIWAAGAARQLLAARTAAVRPDLVAGRRVVLLPALAARRAGRPRRGVRARCLALASLARGRCRSTCSPCPRRLRLLLRPVGPLRRAARRRRAGALDHVRAGADGATVAACHGRTGSRRRRHRRDHGACARRRTARSTASSTCRSRSLATLALIHAGLRRARLTGGPPALAPVARRSSGAAATASTCGTSCRCCCWSTRGCRSDARARPPRRGQHRGAHRDELPPPGAAVPAESWGRAGAQASAPAVGQCVSRSAQTSVSG